MILRTIINTIVKKTLFLLIFVTLTACQQPEDLTIKRQLFVFGTLVDIVIWTEHEALAVTAVADISQQFNDMHTRWHAWKPGRLQDINTRLRAGLTVDLNEEERFLLINSIKLSHLSDGYFNPLMGEIINLWGFHSDEYPITTSPPAPAAIQSLLSQAVKPKDLIIDGYQIRSQNPHIWFDLGGIAKGYAVDLAIETLKKHGIHNAIINAGGDLRTLGKKGDDSWVIAIQSPKDWEPLATMQVDHNEAVFTSGNYRRYKAFDGKRFAHIIDPNNYQPVSQIVSATVIAQDGMLADAAATALVVAGSEWFHVADKMGISEALVVNENHQCFATSAMLKRLSQMTIQCKTPKHLTGGL